MVPETQKYQDVTFAPNRRDASHSVFIAIKGELITSDKGSDLTFRIKNSIHGKKKIFLKS